MGHIEFGYTNTQPSDPDPPAFRVKLLYLVTSSIETMREFGRRLREWRQRMGIKGMYCLVPPLVTIGSGRPLLHHYPCDNRIKHYLLELLRNKKWAISERNEENHDKLQEEFSCPFGTQNQWRGGQRHLQVNWKEPIGSI